MSYPPIPGTNWDYGRSYYVLKPSGDATGKTDASNIMSLYKSLPSTGGIIRLDPSGQWNIKCGIISINASNVTIDAAGCYIRATGSGDMIRMYDSSTYASRSVRGGGIAGFPIIDGNYTTDTSSGIHVGDILGLVLNVQVINFAYNASSKNVWLDNNYYWTEQLTGIIYSRNSPSLIVFDNSANIGGHATGSFDAMDLKVYLANGGTGDGIVMQNGAQAVDFNLSIYGDFNTGSTQYAVMRLIDTAYLSGGVLNFGVELLETTNTLPITIYYTTVNNYISECNGLANFGANQTFQHTNSVNQFQYSGLVLGDSHLYTTSIPTPASAQTINGNAQTLYPGSVSTIITGSSSSYTALILKAGTYQGQQVIVINAGSGTLTFDVSGTSNVADGTSDVIAANTARQFAWNATNSLWYRCS